MRAGEPFPAAAVETQAAEDAYALVLAHAGADLPVRDSLDARIVEEVRTGTATYGETYGGGGKGIIDSQAAVGGWPELRSAPPPADSDHDGMPDAWEAKYGLDPEGAADGSEDLDRDGYTHVEEFLNGTDPTVYVDYGDPGNNRHSLHRGATVHSKRE